MLSLACLFRRISVMPFYAVRAGRVPGIYSTWQECQKQVSGFPRAIFKRFASQAEAQVFVSGTDPTQGESNAASAKRIASKPLAKVDIASEAAPGKLIVYVDGACSLNGGRKARAGYGVFWGAGNPLNVANRLKGKQTNNRAEYQAAICAITQALQLQEQTRQKSLSDKSVTPLRELEVRTDSLLLISSVNHWLKKWRTNGWQTSTGAEVKNRSDVEQLDAVRAEFEARGGTVRFVHVAGHSGEPGNDAADQLAREGAQREPISRSRSRSCSSASSASNSAKSSDRKKRKRRKSEEDSTDAEPNKRRRKAIGASTSTTVESATDSIPPTIAATSNSAIELPSPALKHA